MKLDFKTIRSQENKVKFNYSLGRLKKLKKNESLTGLSVIVLILKVKFILISTQAFNDYT